MNFNEFKEQAINILELNLDGYKIKRVKRRTDSLLKRKNIKDYQQCLHLIKKDNDFRSTFLNHLTINTSEFFRNPKSFELLEKDIFPELFANNRQVKIWSSPCSNGAEPYTMAILLNELNIKPSRFQILASDIDSSILKVAKEGIYNEKGIKNINGKLKKKYFKQIDKNQYRIKDNIKSLVQFEQKDLIKENYHKNCHLILCRNFFIYLTRELKTNLTKKYVDALTVNGYLFLGNTEFLFNPGIFSLKKEHLSFYRKVSSI